MDLYTGLRPKFVIAFLGLGNVWIGQSDGVELIANADYEGGLLPTPPFCSGCHNLDLKADFVATNVEFGGSVGFHLNLPWPLPDVDASRKFSKRLPGEVRAGLAGTCYGEEDHGAACGNKCCSRGK